MFLKVRPSRYNLVWFSDVQISDLDSCGYYFHVLDLIMTISRF